MKWYNYLKESRQVGFVSAVLTPEDAQVVKDVIMNSGMEKTIPKDKLHTTIMYDRRNIINYSKGNTFFKATVSGFKEMGQGKWKALVFLLNSSDFNDYHEELKKLGFEHSYPDYKPHLSIKYKPLESDLSFMDGIFKKLQGKTLNFIEEEPKKIKE